MTAMHDFFLEQNRFQLTPPKTQIKIDWYSLEKIWASISRKCRSNTFLTQCNSNEWPLMILLEKSKFNKTINYDCRSNLPNLFLPPRWLSTTGSQKRDSESSAFTHLFALIFLLKEPSRKEREHKVNIISRLKPNLLAQRWEVKGPMLFKFHPPTDSNIKSKIKNKIKIKVCLKPIVCLSECVLLKVQLWKSALGDVTKGSLKTSSHVLAPLLRTLNISFSRRLNPAF